MRRAQGVALVTLALVAAGAMALAQTPGKTSGRVHGSKPRAAHTAPATPSPGAGAAPRAEAEGETERMDGPDAWDLMGMGPAGLVVPGPYRGGGALERRALLERRHELAKALELTGEQRDRIEAIRDREQHAAIEQRARLESAVLDLRSMLRAPRLDRAALNAKVDELARLRAQMEKARIGMMVDMHAVLTPEQQKKLRSLRDELDLD